MAPFVYHGMTGRRVYRIWWAMRTRCFNRHDDNYTNYGARGVTVCERWLKFMNFYEDMGDPPTAKHTLDRYPNCNGNYEPSNCRWATPEQQANNRRSNLVVEYQGRTMTASQWDRECGFPRSTMCLRLRNGWSVEEAINTPMMRSGPRKHGISRRVRARNHIAE
jgi:hypothetical protein